MRNKDIAFLAGLITFIILYFAFVTNVIDERLEKVDTTEAAVVTEVTYVEPVVEEVVTKPAEPVLVDLGEFRLTAYCSCSSCCGEFSEARPLDDFGNEIVLGASGTVLEAGYSIAVDPDVIPYGTVVYIEGMGEYKAQDCGGAIKGNRIDVYFSNHEDALEFGVQYANVYFFE